jgi:uncharacterized membrane protein
MPPELEAKLIAPDELRLPDLNGLVKGATAVRLPHRRLEAIYFDTPELRLARSGITLRYRTGEDGPPWTVKLPEGSSGATLRRREVSFEGASGPVPPQVRGPTVQLAPGTGRVAESVPELPDLLMCARARAASLERSACPAWEACMSDLIVIGYPEEETAEKVWNELVSLQEDFLVDLEDAAIIRRDQKGRLHVTTPAHHAVTWGTLSGLFWGVLIGLIFLWPLAPVVGVAGGIMGAALGAAGNLGVKDEFRQRVQDMLQPGTSAITVIVRKVTPDKFIEALKPYGGTVLKTSLPHDAEQQLMKALHGDDPSAPTWQQPASAGTQA